MPKSFFFKAVAIAGIVVALALVIAACGGWLWEFGHEIDWNRLIDHVVQAITNVVITAIPATASVLILWLKMRQTLNVAKEAKQIAQQSVDVTLQGNAEVKEVKKIVNGQTQLTLQNAQQLVTTAEKKAEGLLKKAEDTAAELALEKSKTSVLKRVIVDAALPPPPEVKP